MGAKSSSAQRGKVQKNLVREVHRVFRCPKIHLKICCFLCFKIILSNQREVQSDNKWKFMNYMACISYKKNTIKRNRAKFKQTCPTSSTTSRRAKNSTSKIEWSSNRHAREVQLLHAVHFHSRWRQKSWSRHFLIYFKMAGISFVSVQVLGRRKLKNLLWERFVQKKYHLCNTNEWIRKLPTKIHHRSSTWKQQEVQLLHWMNFRWKTFKIVASMKKWSTRESCVFIAAFHRYITCSIPVSGWRATSSGWRSYERKKHVKNRAKFK